MHNCLKATPFHFFITIILIYCCSKATPCRVFALPLLAGGTLAFASLLLQQVMGNPLASDSTLGINSGAQFSLFLVAIFAPQLLDYGASTVRYLSGRH